MPAALSGREDVLPAMNHRSSAITARRKTRFVVRRGRMSSGVLDVGDGRERLNFICAGAKME